MPYKIYLTAVTLSALWFFASVVFMMVTNRDTTTFNLMIVCGPIFTCGVIGGCVLLLLSIWA